MNNGKRSKDTIIHKRVCPSEEVKVVKARIVRVLKHRHMFLIIRMNARIVITKVALNEIDI